MSSFTTSRDQETFTVHAPEVTLAFSLDDGGLRLLQRAGGPNVLGYGAPMPSIDIQIDERGWLAERTFVRYLSHTVDERDGAVELVIVIGVGPLMVYDRYRITGTLIARRASVENAGDDDLQLRGLRLSLPWARVGALESCRFDAPGNSVRPHVPLSVAAAQRRDVLPRRFFAPGLRGGLALERAPTQGPGLLALHDSATEEALLCWYYSSAESALPQIHGNDEALTLAHEISAADWLRSEVGLIAGTQYIMLLHEPWPAALAALRRTWPVCGLRTLDHPAPWVRDAAIYEVHPAELGGFAGLAAALPDLRSLGLNTLCVMPIWSFANRKGRLWDGNWESSGNIYAIHDHEAIDPTLGTPEDLRALIDAAHQQGLRVLLDLPLEGCAADGRLVDEHPDWFCYDERGRLAHVPQQEPMAAFDWSNSQLRDYMLSWALAQARAYDLDGYRVVVPRAEVPNWARGRRGHVSAGGMGVLEAIERLQRELKRIKPDAVLLGEQSGPVYAACHDGTLDDLPHHMFVHLALGRVSPAELGDWLEDYGRVLPHAPARVCYTENYRTRLTNPLAEGLRGSRISRMLLAGIVLCGFVPLIRAGQELEETAFVGQMLQARADYPALRYGRVQYNALPCSSAQIFGVLREHEGERVLGLLNVSPHKQTVVVSLPVDRMGLPEGDYELYSVIDQAIWAEDEQQSWRRDELLSMRLTLDPFAAYCFVVRPAVPAQPGGEPSLLAHRSASVAAPFPAVVAYGEPVSAAGESPRQGRRKRA